LGQHLRYQPSIIAGVVEVELELKGAQACVAA
jgi:hypothetical protein